MSIEARLARIEKMLEAALPKPEQQTDQYLTCAEAMTFLNRSRAWLQKRTIIEFTGETSGLLIRDADWIRLGNRLLYKKSSLLRMKDELKKVGDLYDRAA